MTTRPPMRDEEEMPELTAARTALRMRGFDADAEGLRLITTAILSAVPVNSYPMNRAFLAATGHADATTAFLAMLDTIRAEREAKVEARHRITNLIDALSDIALMANEPVNPTTADPALITRLKKITADARKATGD